MEKLLLHVCCAPCSLGGLDKLRGYEITFFFPNSNIYPEEEFNKRLKEVLKLSNLKEIKVIKEDYNHKKWRNLVKGLETEPEKGKRCLKCFEINLEKTAKKAKELNINYITTTLTTGKQKDSKQIINLGKEVAKKHNLIFLDIDFKKQGGVLKSIKLSKELNIYRQNYCGCEFSVRKKYNLKQYT